jgi:thioesterase domain-containing protein
MSSPQPLLHSAADARDSIIVPLRPTGRGMPLFFVHSALGSTGYYANLARAMSGDAPIYGINSVGLFGDAAPLLSFEEMAARYIEAMRNVSPQGPYLVAGHSMGAYIAFEMCLQLGEIEAPHCLIIDQAAPSYAGFGTLISNAEVGDAVAALISVIAALYSQPLPAPLATIRETLSGLDEGRQLSQITVWLKALRFLPQSASEESAGAFLGVLMANTAAETKWSPGERSYAGTLTVIQAEDSIHPEEAYALWRNHCTQSVRHYSTPGNHATTMTPPHVQRLAALIDACRAAAR